MDVEKGRSSLKGQERAIINQTNAGTISKVTFRKLLRWGGAHVGFSECIDTVLNWTDLSWTYQEWLWSIPFSGPLRWHSNVSVNNPTFNGHSWHDRLESVSQHTPRLTFQHPSSEVWCHCFFFFFFIILWESQKLGNIPQLVIPLKGLFLSLRICLPKLPL